MTGTTRLRWHINDPAERVYCLLIDHDAVQRWKVPDGMSSHVHAFEPSVGGKFRVSLTYDSANSQGKTGAHTDTYHGRFVSLVPNALVVERMAFQTTNAAMSGEMTVAYTLSDSGDGTDLIVVHEGFPDGVRPADNELG